MVPNGRIPGPHSMQQARREEQGSAVSSQSINNVPGVNPAGLRQALMKARICAVHWHIWWYRGMSEEWVRINHQTEDNLYLLSISELHCIDDIYFQSGDFTIYYLGYDIRKMNKVALSQAGNLPKQCKTSQQLIVTFFYHPNLSNSSKS